MNKMQMAHEMALAIQGTKLIHDMELVSDMAWKYADAMQAKADERNKAEAEQKRKEVREILSDANTFIEREGQHFDDVEWQPDWSQAPDDATAWEYLGHGSARWHTTTKGMYRAADLFGYNGTDMLFVERPQ